MYRGGASRQGLGGLALKAGRVLAALLLLSTGTRAEDFQKPAYETKKKAQSVKKHSTTSASYKYEVLDPLQNVVLRHSEQMLTAVWKAKKIAGDLDEAIEEAIHLRPPAHVIAELREWQALLREDVTARLVKGQSDISLGMHQVQASSRPAAGFDRIFAGTDIVMSAHNHAVHAVGLHPLVGTMVKILGKALDTEPTGLLAAARLGAKRVASLRGGYARDFHRYPAGNTRLMLMRRMDSAVEHSGDAAKQLFCVDNLGACKRQKGYETAQLVRFPREILAAKSAALAQENLDAAVIHLKDLPAPKPDPKMASK